MSDALPWEVLWINNNLAMKDVQQQLVKLTPKLEKNIENVAQHRTGSDHFNFCSYLVQTIPYLVRTRFVRSQHGTRP